MFHPMDIGDLRSEYSGQPFRRSDLDPDPTAQFARWFEQAREVAQPEVNACALATMGLDGRPSARTVLLKYFDGDGFVFFTNLESQKARQIAANPAVALLFFWHTLERQVCVRGMAERISAAEALRYFIRRPRSSQLSAWVSEQSSVITSRSVLEMKLDEIKRKFGDGDVPLPSFWGGYRVRPDEIEFWQGRPSRLHDRLRYRLSAGEWLIERLAP
jgi:pyridoxamine 5'-phosphate oxidase